MRFGSFLELPRPPGGTAAESFAQAFAHVDLAEELGLDIICLAEFHFTPARAISSPLTFGAAIAARTHRIRVGTSVLVLPLGNPIRMAEEAATLDQISQGRFEFGVGRSGFQVAYEGYGVAYSESRDRFWESLEVIVKAWTNERFSHAGQFFTYDNVCLVPNPLQRPHPPIRIAATSDETFPVIGRTGYPLLVGLRQVPLAQVVEQVESYRQARSEAGFTGPADISLRLPVYLAETAEEAWSEPEESFMSQFRRVATQLADTVAKPGIDTAEQRGQRAEAMSTLGWEDVVGDRAIVGTPEQAVEQIRVLRERLGITEVVAEFNAGELIPPERIERSLRLLAERVIPALR